MVKLPLFCSLVRVLDVAHFLQEFLLGGVFCDDDDNALLLVLLLPAYRNKMFCYDLQRDFLLSFSNTLH